MYQNKALINRINLSKHLPFLKQGQMLYDTKD